METQTAPFDYGTFSHELTRLLTEFDLYESDYVDNVAFVGFVEKWRQHNKQELGEALTEYVEIMHRHCMHNHEQAGRIEDRILGAISSSAELYWKATDLYKQYLAGNHAIFEDFRKTRTSIKRIHENLLTDKRTLTATADIANRYASLANSARLMRLFLF